MNGRYGARSDLNLTLSGMPLDLARLVAPDLDLSGRLDGGARLTGTRSAPRASGDFAATEVTLSAVRAAGIAGVDMTGKIDWDAVALSLETHVSGGFGGSLTASARLSAPADPATGLPTLDADSSLTGSVSDSARLGVLNDLLAARGDRVEGNLMIDLTLAGRLAGRLTVVEAEIRLPERLPPSIQTLEVEEINVPPDLAARRPTRRPTAGIGAPLRMALDLAIEFDQVGMSLLGFTQRAPKAT